MLAPGRGRSGGADRLHHTGTLVAEYAGQWKRGEAGLHGQIGLAYAGGDHPDHDLVLGRAVQHDLLDDEGLAGAADDRRGGGDRHLVSCGRPATRIGRQPSMNLTVCL
ncbi:hypothetical protein R6Y94_22785 [Plantactinospora sp. KLBMP9567]|nr:hypothetical protein [Plantactinospora sp. KLBMP9567]MDW5326649.1 hypothetical protein [Plantactinospora sp. KLBMP9567]